MKNFFKTGCVVLCSALIIMEIFILTKSNDFVKNSVETEMAFNEATGFIEIIDPVIPLARNIYAEAAATEETEITKAQELIEIEKMIEEIKEIVENSTEAEAEETETTIESEPSVEAITTQPFEIYESVELISKNVPILMYHTSSENNPGDLTELYVKPSEFEKQVQYLSENGFTFCTFDDYDNLNNIDKPIFITFDDGYKENYTEIFPILQKYDAKITLFLIINSITDSNLTKDMIVEMSDSGLVKFESHTNTHPSLVAISSNDARLTDELQNSKIKIEEITGKPVLALAYPNGEFNDIVKDKTQEFYSFGLRKDLGMHNTDYDPFEVRRIRINRSTGIETFKSLVG